MSQIDALTGLRGFVCLLIILFHYQLNCLIPTWIAYTDGLSVSIFFVLSGFLLSYVYSPCEAPMKQECRVMFWKKRLARIGPLYALGLIINIHEIARLKDMQDRTTDYTFALSVISVILSPIGMQSLVPIKPIWFGVGWSISVECIGYLVFPFIRYASIHSFLVLVGLQMPLIGTFLLASNDYELIRKNAIFRIWEFLFAACYTSFVLKENIRLSPFFSNAVPCLWLLLQVGLPYLVADKNHRMFLLINSGFLSSLEVMLVLSLREQRSRFTSLFSVRPLIWLGEISFAAYVIHMSIQDLIANLFDHVINNSIFEHGLFLLVYLLIVLTLAHFIHHWYEEKAYKKLILWLKVKPCQCRDSKENSEVKLESKPSVYVADSTTF